jgi:hypothetical protein
MGVSFFVLQISMWIMYARQRQLKFNSILWSESKIIRTSTLIGVGSLIYFAGIIYYGYIYDWSLSVILSLINMVFSGLIFMFIPQTLLTISGVWPIIMALAIYIEFFI